MEKCSYLFVKNPSKDFSRKRNLTFAEMIKILLSMGGSTINRELINYSNYNAKTVTSSAFCQQRSKILLTAFEFLFHEFNKGHKPKNLYKGYRLLAVDGSDLTYTSNPEDDECYFKIADRKPYNLLHLNALYDLLNNIYVDALIQTKRKSNENSAFITMADRYKGAPKAIFIADRGYESYNNFAHIENSGYNYVIRVKDINNSGILSCFNLPDDEFDIDIERLLTRKSTKEVKNNPNKYRTLHKNAVFDYLPQNSDDFYKMQFRVVRFKIDSDKYECLITNLPREEFDMKDLRELYALRWGIETSFRQLKYAVGMVAFHSKKAELVQQEVFARLIMYNFCEIIITNTIIEKKNRKYTYKANFAMAIQICKEFIRKKRGLTPPNVEALIQKYISPVRNDRQYKRTLKTKSAISFIYRIR